DIFYYKYDTNSGNSINSNAGNADGSTTDNYLNNFALTPGDYYMHIQPKNNAGTWGTERTFRIKYYAGTPNISITFPVTSGNSHDTTTSTITVSGTSTNTFNGDEVKIYVNNVERASTSITSTNGTWSGTVSLSGIGDSIGAQLNDQFGRVVYDTITINYRPKYFTVTPSSYIVNANENFNLSITAFDSSGLQYTGLNGQTLLLSTSKGRSGIITPTTTSATFSGATLNQNNVSISTSGAEDSITLAVFQGPQVIINEVSDTSGSVNAIFIELKNIGTTAQNLTGWKMEFYNDGAESPTSSVTLSGTINPGAYKIVAHNSAISDYYSGVTADFILSTGTNLATSNDYFILRNASGEVVDNFSKLGGTNFQNQNSYERKSSALPNDGTDITNHWTRYTASNAPTPAAENRDNIEYNASSVGSGTTVITVLPLNGFGSATIISPDSSYVSNSETVTLVFTGSSIYPIMKKISIELPNNMTWTGAKSDLVFSGGLAGVAEGDITISGDGTISDSWIITINY
ncbi:MAG TPA: lamin tail domain-containing protein, partial [bacterium]|nr:lamin tail domain-containing protein [bacterium]